MPASVSSTFNTDTDGWIVDGSPSFSGYRSSGGNPDGYLFWLDGSNGLYSYYVAPAKFLGNMASYYGGSIAYDVEDTGANATGQPDLVLTGAGLTLVLAVGQAGTSWTHFTANFDDKAGWKVGSLSGPAATADQLRDVLGSLESLRIRAEYQVGNETGGLDNVVMTAAPNYSYNLFSSPDETTFLGNYATFDAALAAASAGSEIMQAYNDLTIASAQIGVENLTVRGGNLLFSDFTLAAGITTFTGLGNGSWTITGNASSNILKVSGGIATFYADLGNDSYDGRGANAGVDYSANTRSMTVDLAKTGAQTVIGFGNDTLIGISRVDSGSGNDRLYGDDAANDLSGHDGIDRLYGRGGNDRLFGGVGADLLDGGDGADQMFGGYGADTYYVDNTGDRIVEIDFGTDEVDDGAIDKVISTISYTLVDYVENLTLAGTDNLNGTGNSLNNMITGNNGKNVLLGNDGNDRLIGGAGEDTLRGGAGNDILTGGLDADDMDGGEDSDTYYVGAGDKIHDSGTSGIDRVIAVAGWTLTTGDGIERLDTQSSKSVSLIGNELGNFIYGGEGADIIKGLAGSDTLYGGGGADRLEGGADRDFLYGQGGADRFVFKNGDAGATATTFDVIKDFSGTDGDLIDIDAITKRLTDGQYAERTITNDAYGTAYNAAVAAMADGDHVAVFVAGTTNGYLFWNTASGATAPDQSVRLDGVNNIAAFDKSFIV